MHVFIALSHLHDQHLDPSLIASHRTPLAFHWYQATALFHRRLATTSSVADPTTLPSSERDSLWTAGALLGAASFALIDVESVDNVWPLKESDPLDLDWLKMSDGKKVVWHLADPARKDSIFHELLVEREGLPDGTKPIPQDALPAVFYTTFNLNASTVETNPYHISCSLLAQLLPREITDNNIVQFLSFLTQLDPRYRKLLEEKDPRAMILLAWWYTKAAAHSSWWMQRRSLVEGQAICIYLERYCSHVEGIKELVEFPKSVFEICKRNGAKAVEDRGPLVMSNWVYLKADDIDRHRQSRSICAK